MVHRFEDSKGEADKPELCLAFYEKIYGKHLLKVVRVPAFTASDRRWEVVQRAGIDAVLEVQLDYRKRVLVEEKIRSRTWPDIAIELFSSVEHKTPGWVFKKAADFLLYVFEDTKTAYYIPFWLLHTWVVRRGIDDLLTSYPNIPAVNRTYTSLNVAVPIEELCGSLCGPFILN